MLKAKYNVISPEEFLQWREGGWHLPPRSVLLTCDDGLLNTLTDMLPRLRELDVRFLFFVTGSSMEERASMLWYEQLFLWLLHAGDTILFRAPWGMVCAWGREQKSVLWQEMIGKLSGFDAGARGQILESIRTQL